MSETKKCLIERAKLAEQVERYDDMAATMKKVVEMTPVLSEQERSLLAVAYQKVIERRLMAWRILSDIVQKTEACGERQQMAKEYCENVESELKSIVADVLLLLNRYLIPSAENPEIKTFYQQMDLNCNGYLADIAPGDHSEGIITNQQSIDCPITSAKISPPLLMTQPHYSPPSNAKRRKIEASPPLPITYSSAPINNLTDADLAVIFKHLPPYERLIVSEVCRRWRDLSQKTWLDVTTLDLTQVPGRNIAAIIRRCPNLRSVTAVGKPYAAKYLHCLSGRNLCSVKLYDVTAVIPDRGYVRDAYSTALSANLQSAAWEELVLHDFQVGRKPPGEMDFTASFPRSLKRLQLSGSFSCESWMIANDDERPTFLQGLEQLQQLECLMLLAGSDDGQDILSYHRTSLLPMLSRLSNLRELFVGPLQMESGFHPRYTLLPANLPRLEVLFLHKPDVEIVSNFLEGIAHLTTLRILVITGQITNLVEEIECPARKRFPDGFGADPLPLLHVFLGKTTAEQIHFAEHSDAMKVVEIPGRITEFLERAEIAPIFADVWMAEKIKETQVRTAE